MPSNESPALTKSMNMDIWVVGISNQLFTRDSYSYSQTKFQKKKKKLKAPFFVIGSVIFVLTSDKADWYGNIAFSILVVSIKTQYSSFLKKKFIF